MNCPRYEPMEFASGSGNESEIREVGRLDLIGGECKVLLVDGVIPEHKDGGMNKRVRLKYADFEIGHFDFNGHRYVLVAESLPAPAHVRSDSLPTEKEANISDILSRRELEIVQQICIGRQTKQVADRLHISEYTVRSYVKTIYAKLGVRSRAALVIRYMKEFQSATASVQHSPER